jgi:L-glutamine:scyllo-inosose aminotransferase/L-glutamine:2-deoxy-scyllo-inosose/3-amino-2,3-dideoxy-scyllo-inosose aminotransferase
LGAIPILVDVDPETLCMSVDAARKALGPKTAAIMLVHLYGTVGDLDGFVALANEQEIPLIEDCAQMHGARWNGRCVGTYGLVGTFSMQHSKVLTCGEGGAVLTSDPVIYDRLQQLRADGRRYTEPEPLRGFMELEEVGDIQGRNRCLSELQAAVLLGRLPFLDGENRLREKNGEYLGEQLRQRALGMLQRRPSQVDARTFYHFCVRLNEHAFSGRSSAVVAEAGYTTRFAHLVPSLMATRATCSTPQGSTCRLARLLTEAASRCRIRCFWPTRPPSTRLQMRSRRWLDGVGRLLRIALRDR